MNLSYELRTLDQLDGLRKPQPIEPRWTAYEWPEAKGMEKGRLGSDPHRAAYRLDRNKQKDGWWALDDLIRVISGYDRATSSSGWHTLGAVDLVKIMTVFRLLGVDDQLEVCLPLEYQSAVDAYPRRADDQVRKAMEIAAQGATS